MKREEYELQRYVGMCTKRFHERTGKYPSKKEAVRLVRNGRMRYLPPPRSYWGKDWVLKRTYERFAATEIIKKINESEDEDPIKAIYTLYSAMDDLVCDNDTNYAWRFGKGMMEAILEVLELLE